MNRCRVETVKSIEPKIKQLLQSQKEEIEKLKKSFQSDIDKENSKHKEEYENIRNSNNQKIKDAEIKMQMKIDKMKKTATQRENELKAAIDEKIQLIPKKIENAKKKVSGEEELFRKEWEKIITEKIQKEFSENSKKTQELLKNQQEMKIIEIVNQIESSTHDTARVLEMKIEKENKQHQITVNKLSQKMRELEDELNELIGQVNSENSDPRNFNIEEMKDQISKCKCSSYKEQLRKLNIDIADTEEEIKETQRKNGIKNIQSKHDYENLTDKIQIEIERNKNLFQQQKALEKELNAIQEETKRKINDLEEQHKQQISVVGERVKQTVSKKDQVINQLKEKLTKFGLM
ncbi:hypothetical protein TRFO_08373 [Tritrichomonas foetus]|uniref:Uncharacterized protein n=1 Tax=Tritrichomonas foetus TaxID=1144522 RepID=A0A1J4JPJ8_9EUKA|nr:hypothetical protein TRFO_08373 [Tritrichomonas foetus]|eukprot:OHS99445.1 hypothetical protein TRFO_08373 [Tritrichomonas foetus]